MIDTESGETAPLKPTTGQKTRGLTALVVACAALSFFAGASAATAAVAGPTELWAEALGWGKIKLPKVPDWIKDDANKGKKDADEAYEDAVEVIEEGYEGAVDMRADVARLPLRVVRAFLDRDRDGLLVFFVGVILFVSTSLFNLLAELVMTTLFPVLFLALGAAVARAAAAAFLAQG